MNTEKMIEAIASENEEELGFIEKLPAYIPILIEFWGFAKDFLNDEGDDIAREAIGNMNCEEIKKLPKEVLFKHTRELLDGPTGDDDEEALIKIVSCLECGFLVEEYWRRYGNDILADTHGAEYDQLLLELYRCKLHDLNEWDDDVVSRFIATQHCQALAALELDQVTVLIRKLFQGHTGDRDERRINKLIGCLPDWKVQRILQEPGLSFDDFYDEMHGSEWSEFKRIIRRKGVDT